MRSIAIIISFLIFTGTYAQKKKDIVGYYQSADKTSIFKFYKSGDKYVGKLVWMKRPERLDSMNPDPSKRTKKLLGSILVYGLTYDGKDSWTDGYVYDATKGKTFQCNFTRDANGNMEMRGYIGIPVLGKSEYFTKVSFKE